MAEKSSPFLQMNAAPPRPARRLGRRLAACIGVLLLAIVVAAFVWRYFHSGLLTDAVVDGQRAVVTAPADGRVLETGAAADALVKEGQGLFVLDVSAAASGRDAAGQARLNTLEDQLRAAENAEEQARLALRQASQDHARILVVLRGLGQPAENDTAARQTRTRLQAEEATARTALENARTRLETASSARYVAADACRQLRADLGIGRQQARRRPEPPLLVSAPMGGRLTALAAEPGSRVARGQTLAVIEPVLAEQLWISAFVRPADALKLKPEQEFRLRFEGMPDFELTGRLTFVGDAPVPGAPGIPVRLSLEDYDPLTMPSLPIGLQVEAKRK